MSGLPVREIVAHTITVIMVYPNTGQNYPDEKNGGPGMTPEEAVQQLDAIETDPESAHKQADAILLALVPPEVAEAYRRLSKDRCSWWAYA